jgi:integrase
MTENNEMNPNDFHIEESEEFSDEEWLDRLYDKSESINTRNTARVALKTFDQFCQKQIDLNGKSMETMITKYQAWNDQDKPDTRSICLSLSKFVNFMSKDPDDIYVYIYSTFKAKTSKTIRLYFGFVKSYLRVCHGVKVTHEDVKDFIPFPKDRKDARKPISLETIKLIFGKYDPERRALYYLLVTFGMRLGEGLSLKKSNFHLQERPVRISILAEDTKTKESRDIHYK